MWKFWWEIVKRVPAIAWHTALHGEAFISVVLLAILLVDPIAGDRAPHWLGEHRVWGWLLLGAIFVHLLMRAVYEKYESLNRKLASASSTMGEESASERAARLARVCEMLLKHAGDAPGEDSYTPEKGNAWIESAYTLAQQTIRPSARKKLNLSPYNPTYDQFLRCVALLKALAINLRAQELRDGPPSN